MSNLKKHKTEPVSTQFPEWLSVSAAIGRMANDWAGRFDIAAFAGPFAGQGNPACYSPHTGEIEVNSSVCFGDVDPELLEGLDSRRTQYEWPRAVGAIFHEAMHARFSLWDLAQAQRELSPLEFTAMILLEEGRIEAQGLELFPRMSGFLRTMAVDVVVSDIDDISSQSDAVFAANVAALTLARVDAGSLESDDVEAIRELVEAKLGADALAKLRSVWRRFQDHRTHTDTTEMKKLAQEWVSIVKDAASENGDEVDENEGAEDETGGSGSGAGESNPSNPSSDTGSAGSGFMDEMQDALKDAAEDAAIGAYDDLADAEMADEFEEISKAKGRAASERKSSEKISSEVFGSGTTEIHGTSSRSTIITKRAPTPAERSAAVQLANMIDKAKYRERSETEINDIVPPGRLRSRAAVQAAALKSKGLMTNAETWRRTVRKHTDDPTLSIGIMVDISGSMGDAMEPMASTAWILSEAARRADARAAMVYYGNDVFPTLKPGQHLDQVRVWSAPDGTEKFDKAFKALNGGLGLLHGTGVRMLVVVSDGEYTSDESRAAERWVQRCADAGVAVIWLNNTAGYSWGGQGAKLITRGSKAELVGLPTDATESSSIIGRAAVKALASVA